MYAKVVPNRRGKKPWAVDWIDNDGNRRLKSFDRRKEAEVYHRQLVPKLELGTDTAERATITLHECGLQSAKHAPADSPRHWTDQPLQAQFSETAGTPRRD